MLRGYTLFGRGILYVSFYIKHSSKISWSADRWVVMLWILVCYIGHPGWLRLTVIDLAVMWCPICSCHRCLQSPSLGKGWGDVVTCRSTQSAGLTVVNCWICECCVVLVSWSADFGRVLYIEGNVQYSTSEKGIPSKHGGLTQFSSRVKPRKKKDRPIFEIGQRDYL